MRRSIAVFALLLSAALAFGTAYRTVVASAQCTGGTDCDGQGGSGGSGGCGGGMCGGDGSGGGGAGGNEPGQTGEPTNGGNNSGTGGTGGPGNGSDGDAGNNNIRTPTPPPQPVYNSSSGSTNGTKTNAASSSVTTPAPDASLEAWARQLNTTPEEIQSWFGNYTANDTIGGQANAISVHPDDEVTIFDGATTAEAQNADSGPGKRMAIHGIGGTRTKGGDGVDISMHSTAVPLGSTVTDAGGAFTANVQIPHDTGPGRHFIVALAPNVKEGRVAFVFPVSVEAAAAAPVAETSSDAAATDKRFPWVWFEALVGTASVIALAIYRVRRATA